MPRGGFRPRAGRPRTSGTPRQPITWRLPIHLLTRIRKNAEFEGLTVSAWVERALQERLGFPLRKRKTQ